MNSFKVLLKKDLLEIKRNKKWLVYVLSFTIIAIISVITARLLPEIFNALLDVTGVIEGMSYRVSVADSYMQFVANMGEIGLLIILIMFSNTLFKEKSSGTYHLLTSNGVKDYKIVLSHFVSKLILITISYLVSVGVFVVLNLLVFKEYTGLRGVCSLSYLYLTLVFALTLGLFISSFVKKKTMGFVLAIVIYFALSILSVFPYIDIYNPLYALTLGSEIMTSVDYELSDYLINLFVTLGVSVTLLVSSIYIFKNKIDNRK